MLMGWDAREILEDLDAGGYRISLIHFVCVNLLSEFEIYCLEYSSF